MLAQNLNLQPYFYSHPTVVKFSSNNDIVVAGYGRKNAVDSYLPYLAFINEAGELLWEFTDFGPTGIVNDLIVTEHEIIAVGYYSLACDFGGGGFIYIFDYAGNVLYVDGVESEEGTQIYPKFTCLRPNSDLFVMDNFGFESWSSNNELQFFNHSFQADWLDWITDLECLGTIF